MLIKRVILFIMTFIIISVSVPSFAANSHITDDRLQKSIIAKPMWAEIADFRNVFNISITGKATVESILYAFNVDEISIEAELQQYKNGSWTTMKSWTNKRNDIFCAVNETWYIMSGFSYRLVSTGRAYKSGRLIEQETLTSRTYKY